MMTRRLSKRHYDSRQMAFEKLRTIVITAIPKPRSRERFRKIAETTSTPQKRALRTRCLSGIFAGMLIVVRIGAVLLLTIPPLDCKCKSKHMVDTLNPQPA